MIFSRTAKTDAIARVADTIENLLVNNRAVLWLVSGGSAVELQVAVMEQLAQKVPESLDKLTILPIDERYGPAGHANSNSAQMRTAGFNPKNATWIDVLAHGKAQAAVIENYKTTIERVLRQPHIVVASLGLGADGHTAGILPDSPAVFDAVAPVVAYQWADHNRMTLGLSRLRQIDVAFVFAYGEGKQEALQRLQANQEPLSALPAKVLYDIPNVTVYNDYIESEG